ncbi:MAG TPA: YhbD family protein [Bacillales bacterium]|nr:YhbD family protein [Bacillales bacterium]
MEQELISKKELLDLTGISYGQLYRWKRKNLIPEEWFVRKSTYTGQETFFPKEQILARVDKIQNMKGNLSLDELADMFSPNLNEAVFRKEDLVERNIVSNPVMNFYMEQSIPVDSFSFEKVLSLYVLETLLGAGEINLDEAKMVLQVLSDHYSAIRKNGCTLIFIRKLGMSTCFLISGKGEVHLEKSAKIVARLELEQMIEELKIKLM